MAGRLLLSPEQAAILGHVSAEKIEIAFREGRIPRWRIPGKRGHFYDAEHIKNVFFQPEPAATAGSGG